MKNLRRVLSIVLAVIMCISLASCSMVDEDDTKITSDNIKIGVIIPGKAELGDGEFNDLNTIIALDSIEKLTSFGYGISQDRFRYQEGINPTDADAVKSAITSLINLECNIIFLADGGYQSYIADFAKDENNQDVKFVCKDLIAPDANPLQKNVFTYYTDDDDSLYLMGIVAGLKAAELKADIGFLVGDEATSGSSPFFAGAKSVNPSVKIVKGGANDAETLVKAGCKVLASDFYSEDIDNIANKNGVYFCGYGVENYTDADYEGESNFLCAPMFDFAQYFINFIKSVIDENESVSYHGDFKTGSTYISGYGEKIANGTKDAVANAVKALNEGKLTYPVEG